MPYTYAKVNDLEKTTVVGNHQCVALVRHYAGAPDTLGWKQGVAVLGNRLLRKGTAIATFINGRYSDGKWLQCSYGVHGEVTLSKRKDDSVSLCEFTYSKGSKAGQNKIDIDCR